MSRVRKPAVGDRVIVKDHWNDREIHATVDLLLSSQFVIETDDGERLIMPYIGDWKYE